MVQRSAVICALRLLVMTFAIGMGMGWTSCAAAHGVEQTPTLGPFSSQWVELVRIGMNMTPNQKGTISISLQNKTGRSFWATLVVRTPDPTQDCQVAGRLDANATGTYDCSRAVSVTKEPCRLLVRIYEDEGLTKLQGSLQATFQFRKAGEESFEIVVSPTVSYVPTLSSVDSTVRFSMGDRIRVHTSKAPKPFLGNVAGLDDTTITLATDPDERQAMLRRQDITRVDVGRRQGSKSKHALVGAAIGAVFGALIGFAGGDTEGMFSPTAEQGALLGAILLAPIGAVVGYALPVERWERVFPVPVSVAPVKKGGSVALTYSF